MSNTSSINSVIELIKSNFKKNTDYKDPKDLSLDDSHLKEYIDFIEYTPSDLKSLYLTYDSMERDSLDIGSLLESISEESTMKNKESKKVLWVSCEDVQVAEIINTLLKRIKVDDHATPICRNIAKYGRWVVRPVYDKVDETSELFSIVAIDDNVRQNIKSLQHEPYYTTVSPVYTKSKRWLGYSYKGQILPPWYFVQFKLGPTDYGNSILEDLISHQRKLNLLERALEMFRLTKSPQLNIFKIPVGSADTTQIFSIISRYKRFVDNQLSTGNKGVDRSRQAPNPINNLFWPESSSGSGGVEVVSNTADIANIADIEYARNKFLRRLGLPKDDNYEPNKNLSSLNIKVMRKTQRVQEAFVRGIDYLIQLELSLNGIEVTDKLYQIHMSSPSDLEETLRLEKLQLANDVSSQLFEIADVMSATKGGTPDKWKEFVVSTILSNYYGDLSDQYEKYIKTDSSISTKSETLHESYSPYIYENIDIKIDDEKK